MNPPTRVRHAVLGLLCAAAALAYVQRGALGAVESAVRDDLGLSAERMGDALGAFFLAYAVLQVPAGLLADAWGPRRALAGCVLAGSVAAALSAAAGGLGLLLAARLLMGAAQAGTFPAAVKAVGAWLPPGRAGLASGLLAFAMSAGTAAGAPLTTALLGPLGWRGAFLAVAALGVAWLAAFWPAFRDRPDDHPGVNDAELALVRAGRADTPAAAPGPTPWLALALSPALGWVCGQQFFRAAANVFFLSWFTTYLAESRGLSLRAAGAYTSVPVAGLALGALAGGWLSDLLLARTGSRRVARRGLAVASLLASGVILLTATAAQSPAEAVAVIAAGTFVSALAGPVAYAASIDLGGRHTAAVFSTMNMAGNVGAAAFPVLLPRAVAWAGSWEVAPVLFAGCYLAAAVCWLALDPDGTAESQSLLRRPPRADDRG